MPAAPGKRAVTINLPYALKLQIGVEAEKRGMRKSHLIQYVLEKFLPVFLEGLDSKEAE